MEDDEGPARRRFDWTGPLWPAEPETEPKLMQCVEGTSSWPIEPLTEPKLTMDAGCAEPPSVQIVDEPIVAPRYVDNLATEQVPTVPQEAPARPTPRPKRPPPAPFREQRTERAPEPGARVDRVGRPDTAPVPRLQLVDPSTESRPFLTESDTLAEGDPFDDE